MHAFSTRAPVVQYVKVSEASDVGTLRCGLTAVEEYGHVLSRWSYGMGAPGFALGGCGQLSPGERYWIRVGNVGGLGAREFALRPDGTVDDLGHEWW
jgi:hypothetical protein